ncbi:glucosaminidase domain-containing protein [Colwellia sp. MEBiC06753]
MIKPYYIGEQEPTDEVVAKPKEKPLHNVDLPDFDQILDVEQKKRAFFSFIRPSVEKQNSAILAERKFILSLLADVNDGLTVSAEQQAKLAKLVKKYRVSDKKTLNEQLVELEVKVDKIPAPLVLVQAANESAWGTSRFARIGLNFFGIWCYRPGCGMVPRSRDEAADHEVQAFQSVDDAVTRYLHNINTNAAYGVFRTIRKQLRDQEQPLVPEVLATGLLPYSERGSDYVVEISDMLRHNKRFFEQANNQAISSP